MELTMKEKKSLAAKTAERYAKATKAEKKTILDEFVASTGYNRKYAISTLNARIFRKTSAFNGRVRKSVKVKEIPRKRRVRPCKYGEDVAACLKRIWIFFNGMCSQRLVPLVRENIESLQRAKIFGITDEVAAKLLEVSSSTVDRKLKKAREAMRLRGISTTKKAGNLSSLIPIRTCFDFDERKPGFFEIDTVAHCGASSSGEFISTLTATDVCLCWTELRALKNKAHRWVVEAISDIKNSIPFEMKGIDSDNGGEFKNSQLLQWTRENGVQYTRGRPYKKNDNCFVEQKNDSVVRKITGYARFEGDAALDAMNELYKKYNLLVNYFYPSLKIIAKTRIDAKVKKRYDEAKTPFRRCIESKKISAADKRRLRQKKAGLDGVALKREVDELQKRLFDLAATQL